MKTLFLLLGCLICSNIYSQETDIENQLKIIDERLENRYDNLDKRFSDLKTKFISLKGDMENTKTVVNNQAGLKLKTWEQQKKRRKHQHIQTTVFVKSASKSFRAIDASIAQSSYMGDVIKLNSPTNNDLGFSLKSVIEELIQKHITSKDKKLGKVGKVSEFVTNLIEHPITEIAKSAIPAINTVVSFISNLTFGSKKINQEDFNRFIKELKKFVEHYEGLAKATKEYESNLQQIQIRTLALEIYLEAFANERVIALYPNDQDMLLDKEKLEFNEFLRKYYSDDVIKSKLEESKSDILDDKRFYYPIAALNQAGYIQDELKSLSNQYIRVNQSYFESISETLEKSKELGENYIPKIDKKLKELSNGLNIWISKYSILVDVEDVKKEFTELANNN